MKIRLLFLFFLLSGIVACAPKNQVLLPELTAASDEQVTAACTSVFPGEKKAGEAEGTRGEKWQIVHAIDFTMRDGSGTTVIGVTKLDGEDIECALMTVEGLTLFEAVFPHDKDVEVRRAVPPFDKPEFAKGLIVDLRAIFLPPPGRMQTGFVRLPSQPPVTSAVCRYRKPDQGIVDVLPNVHGCWRINSYTPDHIMQRSIVGRSCKKIGSRLIPDYIDLTTYGRTGYTLKMTLISADTFQ